MIDEELTLQSIRKSIGLLLSCSEEVAIIALERHRFRHALELLTKRVRNEYFEGERVAWPELEKAEQLLTRTSHK